MSDSEPEPEADETERPDTETAPEQYRDDDRDRVVHLFAAALNNAYPILGGSAVVIFLLSVILDAPRSLQIVSGSFILGYLLIGRATGRKAMSIIGGPDLVWIVDVDLLDGTGAGVYNVPRPRWSEDWTVSQYSLWWATPNLAFGRGLDQEEQTVEGVWRGSLPDPVLMRALEYIRYNRQSYRQKAQRGQAIELNKFSILRNATMKAVRNIVETFDKATLPDDGDGFAEEVDAALQEAGVEDSDLFDPDDSDSDSVTDFDFDNVTGGSPNTEAADD